MVCSERHQHRGKQLRHLHFGRDVSVAEARRAIDEDAALAGGGSGGGPLACGPVEDCLHTSRRSVGENPRAVPFASPLNASTLASGSVAVLNTNKSRRTRNTDGPSLQNWDLSSRNDVGLKDGELKR